VNEFNGPTIPGASGSGGNGFINVLNQQLVFGTTYVMANGSALEARLGVSKIEGGKRPPLSAGRASANCTASPACPTILRSLAD
jgi:hypothetical protein